jgi:hypothetical protein
MGMNIRFTGIKNMSLKKTTPVKRRTIYVYLPNIELVDLWKKSAKKAGVSISIFVQEAVDRCLAEQGHTTIRHELHNELQDATERIQTLSEENYKLTRKLQRMNMLLERYENQIQDMENKKFIDDEFQGIRRFEKALIDLFKEKGYINDQKILDLLHVKPTDKERIKALQMQIDLLLEYGLIKVHKGGFIWQG